MSKDEYGNKVCELLERELSDIPFFDNWTFELAEKFEGWEYYDVKIRDHNFNYLIRANADTIQVDMNEGSWEDIRTYDWTIKYFWMTILDADYLI